MKRSVATVFASVLVSLVGVICSLSMGVFSGYTFMCFNFFDLLDFIAANVLLPLGGMFISLFIGWRFGKYKSFKEVAHGGTLKGWFLAAFIFLTRYFAPAAILVVFVYGLYDKLHGCLGF